MADLWQTMTQGIDEAAYQALLADFDGDLETMRELVDLFDQNAPTHVRGVEAAASASDLPAGRGSAHSLKSSAASLGALRLAKLCEAAERAPDAEAFRALAAHFAPELTVVLASLRRRFPA